MLTIFLCVVCIVLYCAGLLLAFCINKKLEGACTKSSTSGLSGGEIASRILYKYSVISEEDAEIENEKLNDTENNEENEEEIPEEQHFSRSRDYSQRKKRDFVYPSEDDGETISENDIADNQTAIGGGASYAGVVCDNRHPSVYKADVDQTVVKLGSKFHDESSLGAQSVGTYSACLLISKISKPFIYSFISFLTAIPSFIIQWGWFFCCIILFDLLYLPATACNVMFGIIISSFAINLLRLPYCFYLNKMISENIVDYVEVETEMGEVQSTTRLLTFNHALGGFGFIRWFVRSFLGYKL